MVKNTSYQRLRKYSVKRKEKSTTQQKISLLNQAIKLNGSTKVNKYRNKITIVDDITFHSKKEADRYLVLNYHQKIGLISGLELQKKYALNVNGTLICSYIADFVYMKDGIQIVNDVKGFKTRIYSLKKKLMKAVHNIEILET